MNPETSRVWSYHKPENKTVFEIHRQKKTICFGNPGYILTWECWSSHPNAKERNKVLKQLQEEHPLWILKSVDRNPFIDSLIARSMV